MATLLLMKEKSESHHCGDFFIIHLSKPVRLAPEASPLHSTLVPSTIVCTF